MERRCCDALVSRQLGAQRLWAALLPCLLGLVIGGDGMPPSHSHVHMCCSGQNIRFGMIPMTLQPYFTYHETATGNARWGGYWTYMIDAVAAEMGFTYTLVPDDSVFTPQIDALVSSGGADVGFVDLSDPKSFTPGGAANWVHTMPVFDSRLGAVVLKTRKETGYWQLTKPISPELWAAIFITVFLAAILMNVLGGLNVDEGSSQNFSKVSVDDALKTVYHMFAALLGGEDYEWVTWPGRLLRLGVLFFMLIVTTTYTANLAAFFTVKEYKIHGPKDLAELRSSTVCALNPGYDKWVKPYSGKVVYASADPANFDFESQRKICRQMLIDKKADAWMDDGGTLTSYILRGKNCESLHLVSSINVVLNQPGWLLRKADSELAFNISAALVHFKMQPQYQAILQEEFGVGRSLACSEGGDDDEDSMSVKLDNMWGLFIITGAFFFVAVALACASAGKRLSSKKENQVSPADGKDDISHTMTEGEMLRTLLRKVNEMSADKHTKTFEEA